MCMCGEDNDWVKKCTEYKVEGSRPRGRPNRTWREDVQKDYQTCKLNRKDVMDRRSRWWKLIKDEDQDRCEWVNVLVVPAHRVVPGKGP